MSLECMPYVGYSHEDRGGWAYMVATAHSLGQLSAYCRASSVIWSVNNLRWLAFTTANHFDKTTVPQEIGDGAHGHPCSAIDCADTCTSWRR